MFHATAVIFRWRNVVPASRGLHRLREGHDAGAMEVALSSGAIHPGGNVMAQPFTTVDWMVQ